MPLSPVCLAPASASPRPTACPSSSTTPRQQLSPPSTQAGAARWPASHRSPLLPCKLDSALVSPTSVPSSDPASALMLLKSAMKSTTRFFPPTFPCVISLSRRLPWAHSLIRVPQYHSAGTSTSGKRMLTTLSLRASLKLPFTSVPSVPIPSTTASSLPVVSAFTVGAFSQES